MLAGTVSRSPCPFGQAHGSMRRCAHPVGLRGRRRRRICRARALSSQYLCQTLSIPFLARESIQENVFVKHSHSVARKEGGGGWGAIENLHTSERALACRFVLEDDIVVLIFCNFAYGAQWSSIFNVRRSVFRYVCNRGSAGTSTLLPRYANIEGGKVQCECGGRGSGCPIRTAFTGKGGMASTHRKAE